MSKYEEGFKATTAALEQGVSIHVLQRRLDESTNVAYATGCESAIRYWEAEGKFIERSRPLAPRPQSVWLHRKGVEYTVILTTSEPGEDKAAKFPVTVVYSSPDGRIWSRLLESFLESFTFVRDLPKLPEEAHARYAHLCKGFLFGMDIEQMAARDLRTVIGYLLDPKTIR